MTQRSEVKTRLILILRFLVRSAGWGAVMGAAVGFCGIALFGILLTSGGSGGLTASFQLIVAAVALVMLMGAAFGVVAGGLSGVVLGIITAIFFYEPRRLGEHKWATLLVVPGITVLSFVPWYSYSARLPHPSSSADKYYVLLLGAGGLVAAVIASLRIAKWYLKWHSLHYVHPAVPS